MSKKHDFRKIEQKRQKKWLEEKIYEPDLDNAPKPFYNLMMFPYPSAEGLHVGNVYAFTGSDIYGRFKRMQGNDVLEPIGLDGFGIHSENYALKIGAHPMEQAKVSEKRFYEQLQMIGNGFAWDERLETYDPEYYKWTQWIFTQMWKHGLAYRKKQAVNWCPSCKTVLADEQVISGACERCSTAVAKKELEQWFFRITKYAERLLRNLEKLDWSEKVKIAQKSWIGKSEGALLDFPIQASPKQNKFATWQARFKIQVFTTRPDTLFGATYMVLSPEHPLLANSQLPIANREEVDEYLKKVKAKSDEERIAEGKEKTGVELRGVKAINPATKEEIPVWVADYVLMSYGTGAIMAVPAHDERDREFAKKYNLPIRQVIAPYFLDRDGKDAVREDKPTVRRRTAYALVKHHKEDKYLCLNWEKYGWHSGIIGGIESGEDPVSAAIREIKEETGYRHIRFVKHLGGEMHNHYYAAHKGENRYAVGCGTLFELVDDVRDEIEAAHTENHKPVWVGGKKMGEWLNLPAFQYMWEMLSSGKECFTGEGILVNSGEFTEVDSEKAKWEITKFVGGEKKIQYHLRDWLISRQRYWGPPIPMIYCEACAKGGKGEQKEMPGWYAAPERDLPVELPFVKDFRPSGKDESPLASVKSFYEVECPACKGKARRETDVSDTFLDSAWYYLRYIDVNNKKQPFDELRAGKWLPVNMYIGGAEHSVLHLLYVRFLAMALHDMGHLSFEEPFPKFRAHGLLISEGAKMSKSKGNVVNPDEYIKKFGADTLRMYLMFLAPFEQGGDFRDRALLGISRFLERVWKMGERVVENKEAEGNDGTEKLLHKTIKKVSDDIENLKYNTAISALMVLLSGMDAGEDGVAPSQFGAFLKLLAPFAPHITEELWHQLGHASSIHREQWPSFDPKLFAEATFQLVIQVNGKVRDSVAVSAGMSEPEIKELALSRERIKQFLGSQKPKRTIYVPQRLINIVA